MRAEDYLNWDTALSSLIGILKNEKQRERLRQVCGVAAVVVLRDWRGQIHLCLPCNEDAIKTEDIANLLVNTSSVLGPLSAAYQAKRENAALVVDDFVLLRDQLFDSDDIWNSPDLVALDRSALPDIMLLDRQNKAGDWLRAATSNHSAKPRGVFFGVKGGVGRSAALTALALHLASQGKHVLVVDADFESPGVSSSLLNVDARPDYGIVDWFAAQALGLSKKDLDNLALRQLVEPSPLGQLTNGKILVAPVHGTCTQAYVNKLGRMYRNTEDGLTFADRLTDLISRLERLHHTDVTLIDSRAGIDDTAAVTMTQIGAWVTFMFAVNTRQTWDAYSILFKHLERHPSRRTEEDYRFGLRMVSAMTPEEAVFKGYWESFRSAAYDTCVEHLYEEIEDSRNDEEIINNDVVNNPFNFSFDDEDAPHFPLRIMWDEVLRAFDPVSYPEQLAPAVIQKVFGDFLARAEKLLG